MIFKSFENIYFEVIVGAVKGVGMSTPFTGTAMCTCLIHLI